MALIESFNNGMRPLLDAIDKLRNFNVADEGIALPSIVVVGDQSSGKSSVLESLSGISLPRGNGIVTRVPLVLRLQNAPENTVTIEYKDSSRDVVKEIQEENVETEVKEATNILAGSSKGVVNKPINLTVIGPGKPDLTLVDLPGITRVPVAGQPQDIHSQIKTMIFEYIKPDESVILNVISASTDFSTCESIVFSKEVDPIGIRTLAVVTKVDREPEAVFEKVTGNSVDIGLGFICVRNKLPTDESNEEAREKERDFFSCNELGKLRCGIPTLARTLTAIQVERVKAFIPQLEKNISSILSKKQLRLSLIPPTVQSESEALVQFHDILSRRKEHFKSLFNGDCSEFLEDAEMNFAARLEELFASFVEEASKTNSFFLSKPCTELCIKLMKESKGVTLSNFLSHIAFLHVIKVKLNEIQPQVRALVDSIRDYAEAMSVAISERSSHGFPNASAMLSRLTTDCISHAHSKCLASTNHFFMVEKAFAYTNNQFFMDNASKLRNQVKEIKVNNRHDLRMLDGMSLDDLVSNEDQTALEMQICLFAYWEVIIKRMCDVLPMNFRFTFHTKLLDGVHNSVMREIAESEVSLQKVMDVKPGLKLEKDQLNRSIAKLQEASRVLKSAVRSASEIASDSVSSTS